MKKLNKEQMIFAEKNHNIIHTFLKDKGLKEDEFYDIVVFSFLKAVQSYLTKPSQREFKDIAYIKMSEAVIGYLATVKRSRSNIEFVNIDSVKNSMLLTA